ncbi:hypothetical protein [Sulfobacillus harzensis]|uniref:Uncharacterized protein n=1 Tax=Sulfobacillus harzensis TaxID=2729629 RepID=A0A7Y0L7T6_9FIRM|nr:hypothetical protein [Sulfobacillus harzensis]NMP24015.1 hypothetical protein [Sulfobacillus harzensis]
MPSWTRDQMIEHLTPPPGIAMPPYPHRQDQIYRWSLLATTAGLAIEGVGWLLSDPLLRQIGQGWTSLALAVAGWTFLVWLRSWRFGVRTLSTLGLVFWLASPLIGWAFSLASLAIMAAKETHCFHFPAGRVIPWYALALGLAMIARLNPFIIGIGWLGLTGLGSWLVWGRWHLPLFEI